MVTCTQRFIITGSKWTQQITPACNNDAKEEKAGELWKSGDETVVWGEERRGMTRPCVGSGQRLRMLPGRGRRLGKLPSAAAGDRSSVFPTGKTQNSLKRLLLLFFCCVHNVGNTVTCSVHRWWTIWKTKPEAVEIQLMQILRSPCISGTPRAACACYSDCKLRQLGFKVGGIVVLIL